MANKKIIAFVNHVSDNDAKVIKEEFQKLGQAIKIIVLKDTKKKREVTEKKNSYISNVLYLDFDKSTKVVKELKQFVPSVSALVCRGESHINSFRKMIPQFPYIKTPTSESLYWATDKIAMRERFYNYDKNITPNFLVLQDSEAKTIDKIIKKLNFPLIIKPANLDSSMLVKICYHREELEQALRQSLRKIRTVYKNKKRKITPKILAEQYMPGEMYSVDAYINSKGKIYFCPFVRIKTGQDVGIDDFFNYFRFTPVNLSQEQMEQGKDVAKKGIYALGLKSTSVHIELMKIEDKWKIIEIGPRLGGFRKIIYELSYNINHVVNDVLIRMDKKPVIPKKVQGYTQCFKFYPKQEGVLKRVNGINKIKKLKSFNKVINHLKIGDRCYFSKNGGKSVLDIVLFNSNKQEIIADQRRVEKLIDIETGKK